MLLLMLRLARGEGRRSMLLLLLPPILGKSATAARYCVICCSSYCFIFSCISIC